MSNSTDPEDYIEHVKDQRTFILFLQRLGENWDTEQVIEKDRPSSPYGSGALGWQSGTIGQFLEAAAACGTAHLEKDNWPFADNPWRAAAEIIFAGKYYE